MLDISDAAFFDSIEIWKQVLIAQHADRKLKFRKTNGYIIADVVYSLKSYNSQEIRIRTGIWCNKYGLGTILPLKQALSMYGPERSSSA